MNVRKGILNSKKQLISLKVLNSQLKCVLHILQETQTHTCGLLVCKEKGEQRQESCPVDMMTKQMNLEREANMSQMPRVVKKEGIGCESIGKEGYG